MNANVWPETHRLALAAELARVKALLGAGGAAGVAPAPSSSAALDVPASDAGAAQALHASPLARLAVQLGLSAFERDLLVLAAGVELDAEIAARVPRLNFALAMSLLPGAHWSAISPLAPLRAWRLLELEGASPSQARLRIDERVLHLLMGVNELDARLVPLLKPHAAPALMGELQRAAAARLQAVLSAAIEAPAGDVPAAAHVLLAGDDRDGQRDVAACVAAGLGRALLVLSAADLPAAAAEQEALATLWLREAALLPAALLVDLHDDDGAMAAESAGHGASAASGDESPRSAVAVRRWLARMAGPAPVFIAAREAQPWPALTQEAIAVPEAAERKLLWQQALRLADDGTDEMAQALPALAAQYAFSAAQITARAQALRLAAPAGEHAAERVARLWAHCRVAARPRLRGLAERVAGQAGWDDLVLNDAARDALHRIAAQVRLRLHVYGEWGFEARGTRGLGISVLFHGDSGVGKTLACEVLARELELDLLKIDLSRVVSKYIGETEKNLSRIFDAAEGAGALLLFDEADALFGKRSEVKDSHDRYANIEIGHLLQRMESYRGLAVLTTNQRGALDGAFLRRLRFVVHFPFPDERQREAIWQRVFPAAMPRAELDCACLARLPLSGGQIRNIALTAAFLAAEAGEVVAMPHLARAAQLEAAKNERGGAEGQLRELRGWHG